MILVLSVSKMRYCISNFMYHTKVLSRISSFQSVGGYLIGGYISDISHLHIFFTSVDNIFVLNLQYLDHLFHKSVLNRQF